MNVAGSEGANDLLTVNGLGGNDFLDGSSLAAGVAGLTLDGGAGNDVLAGSQAPDALLGGDGNDTFPFEGGFHRMDGGPGDDTFAFVGTNRHDFIRVDLAPTPGGPQVVVRNWFAVSSSLFLNGETVSVSGGDGNDIIIMGRAAGATWKAAFFGGRGNDRLVGGSLNDTLDGGAGYNVLQGAGGTDVLLRGRIVIP